MTLRLQINYSKSNVRYYIKEDFNDPDTGKRTTRVYQNLGDLPSLLEQYNLSAKEELEPLLRAKVKEENRRLKTQEVSVRLSPTKHIDKGQNRLFNVGYLYPQKILSLLGISSICSEISKKSGFTYNLEQILRSLVLTRIISPGSKRASMDSLQRFYHYDAPKLHQVYRALEVLSKERYCIESAVYQASKKICSRNDNVLYYDCTNFYFETEDEDGFRKYGKSKENRPNPLVQYGLFMDGSGIPIADIVFPGNKNECPSMGQLEEIMERDFQTSRFIVCADCALNSYNNKIYNHYKNNGAYIVTQSVKKLKKYLKEWALEPTGWKVCGCSTLFDIRDLEPESKVMVNGKEIRAESLTFYKDRWCLIEKPKDKKGESLPTYNEHLIVSYSLKYREYQQKIRNSKLERASKLLKNPGKIAKTNNQRDPRYYIRQIKNESEDKSSIKYELNTTKIAEDMKYDGFYGVVTDLEDEDIELIIKVNHRRWEIEECFRIMKSELQTRPMFVWNEEKIKGHLLTCFLALVVYRILEQYLKSKYTVTEILDCLQSLNMAHLKGPHYIPAFTRTDLTDSLSRIFGYVFDTEVSSETKLNKCVMNAAGKSWRK